MNEDGIWNTYNYNDFTLEFGKVNKNKVEMKLSLDEILVDTKSTIVSLYTFNEEALKKNFNLDNFYEKSVVRQMSNKEIYKFYVKN